MSVQVDPQPDYRFLLGRDTPPDPPLEVRAGPLSALFDGADLRRLRVGPVEVVRRIYVAIRDVNWDTVIPTRLDHRYDIGEREFRISYQAQYTKGELDLPAEIIIEGRPDGSLRFGINGEARTDFPYCRMGICVLHPPTAAGRPYRAMSPEGEAEGMLPALVGPQWLREGKLHALFEPYDRLVIDMAGEVEVDFRFDGDLFEMEDQRNWTDASFKTYSTPLRLGFPHQGRRGLQLRQSVELHLTGAGVGTGLIQTSPEPVKITVGGEQRSGLPQIGLDSASQVSGMDDRSAELLRQIATDHIRFDLKPAEASSGEHLQAAVASCRQLGTELEVALHIGNSEAADLDLAASQLRGAPIRRFLVFKDGSPCSQGALVKAARSALASDHPDAEFFGGTNLYFAELNRTRPLVEGMDGIVFSITPQVHDGDEMSVMENAEAQADVVRSARAIAGAGLKVAVSPLTLKPRFNPFANRPLVEDSRQLPLPVDARQAALFGAAWTLASLKNLIEGGADTVTYYETAGWRGLVETDAASPRHALFPSRPGMVFPLYWVFRDLAGWRGATVLNCLSSDPLRVVGLALRLEARNRVLLANLTTDPQELSLTGPGLEGQVKWALVDQGSYDPAPADPASATRTTAALRAEAGMVRLKLGPFAVACLDY